MVRSHLEPVPTHTHDFAEVCLIDAGGGWHDIGGRCHRLIAGTVLFIRPGDCHGFQADPGGMLALVNVAFPAATLDFIRTRYFPGERRWFWSTDSESSCRPPAGRFAALRAEADRLAAAPPEAFHRDRFLLNILAELGAYPTETPLTGLPDWLAEACRQLEQPARLREGTRALQRLSGRSPEHLARVMREKLGMTPSDYVNRRRLDHAARRLKMSTVPVTQIAYDCGYESLSHFFHLFRASHGCSPGQYRATNRLQPV